MTLLSVPTPQNFGLLLIAAAAIAFYIAARVAMDALTNLDNPSPTRLAIAHWLPIAIVALTAVILGHPIIAVCITFGTSVAALTLNLGLIAATTGHEIGPEDSARAWPMLLPAALLAFVAGFSAKLTIIHAILFAIEALMVALVWFPPSPPQTSNPPTSNFRISPRRYLMLTGALIISTLGALLAIHGTIRLSTIEIPLMTPGLIAAVALSPLLVLPMIGAGTLLAERGKTNAVASSLVGVTFLNLCVLLPVLVAAWLCRRLIAKGDDLPDYIPFPIATWRVDTVLILITGALLIPVALGRWRLGRLEGVILVLIYAAYLGVTAVLSLRW